METNKYYCTANKCAQKVVLHLLVFAGLAGQVRAQQSEVGKLEKQVQFAVAKARPASVYLVDYDPKTKAATGGRFSGVVVNAEGVILTAAHATAPNRIYRVTFPDGKEYTATGIGRISGIDAAALKINEKGTWPVAEMGWSSSLKVSEPCISIAYPASFDTNRLVIRFGFVEEVSSKEKANRIRTTCLMEPGDSGGPTFDLLGRVIGIHSSITNSLESNFEVPVDLYRKYWNALQQPEDYENLPIGEEISPDTLAAAKLAFNNLEIFYPSVSKSEAKFNGLSWRISSMLKGQSETVTGTLISLTGIAPAKEIAGKSFLISKNSMVGDNPAVELGNGKTEKARIIARDEGKDLVLLEIKISLPNGIALASVPPDTLTLADLGKFLISPQPGAEGIWSVVGTTRFDLPMKYRAGYSGAGSVMKDGKVVLNIVQANTGASAARLRAGDQVLSLNGVTIKTPDHYINEMRKYKPDDVVTLVRFNAGITDTVKIKLGKYPPSTSHHPAETFTGGKSEIRDGFSNAFVHDAKIIPSRCGGPVFTTSGIFMGINMARYSRTSTIVVTTPELLAFVYSALQPARKDT